MLESVGTAAGGLGGGLMGQLGGALSAPRRAAWSMLGLPEHGADLVSSVSGMDATSPLARYLGMGAEMVLDPLSIAGMALGGPAAKALAFPWQQGRRASRAAEMLPQAQDLILRDLSRGLEASEAARGGLPRVAAHLARNDLPGIAAGATKSYRMAHPDVIRAFEEANLGRGLPPNGLEVLGSRLPEGSAVAPLRFNNRMAGKGPAIGPDGLPSFRPGEAEWLQSHLQAGELASDPLDIGRQLAVERAAKTLGQRREPTLAALLDEGAFGPPLRNELPPELLGMPARQALEEVQRGMPFAMQQARRYSVGPADLAMIGGAGLGAGLGGYLFSR